MGNQSSSKIFPLSFKTAAFNHLPPFYPVDTGNDAVYDSTSNPKYGVIGFQMYQPYNLYAVKNMYMHFRCQFAATVPTAQQIINRIVVGSNGNSQPSPTAPYKDINITPSSGVIDFTIDLKNLITATGDNIIFLCMPKGLVPGDASWSGSNNQIIIQMWKVDMLYQTVGIR